MSKLELEGQFVLQEGILNALQKAVDQGYMIIHELQRKATVKTQASTIIGLVEELEGQAGYIEYLKTGNEQAFDRRSSIVDTNIVIPSVEEMSKLDLESQFELQDEVIDSLKKALEPGWSELKRLDRQNRHIQRTEDTNFVHGGWGGISELDLKTEVEEQAAFIRSLLIDLEEEQDYVHFLIGDSDQGRSSEDTNIVIPSVEELLTLDLEAQSESQAEIIDNLRRAIRAVRGEIDELERQRCCRCRQRTEDATFVKAACDRPREFYLKTEVEEQLTAIQSLQRDLKRQRRKLEYLGGDSDQCGSTMEASIVLPSLDEMSKLELEGQFVLQEGILNALQKAVDQGSMIICELQRKATVKTQASTIIGLVEELEGQAGYIEYLKTGNEQAFDRRSSIVDTNIVIPSLEEMSKLDLESQFELQDEVIDALKKALEPGWSEIKRLDRQNRHIQRTEDSGFAMPVFEEVVEPLELTDRDGDGVEGTEDELWLIPKMRGLVGIFSDSESEDSSMLPFDAGPASPRTEVSVDFGRCVEGVVGPCLPVEAERQRDLLAAVGVKAAVRTEDCHGASTARVPVREPTW
jgi:uncharacterized coiled-coil protein SlyX